MKKFNDLQRELQCHDIKTIEDINKKFEYEDTNPPSKKDGELVSCGQQGYNELKFILENVLDEHIKVGKITSEDAIKAMCSACFKIKNPRQRSDFYSHLEKCLDIKIS